MVEALFMAENDENRSGLVILSIYNRFACSFFNFPSVNKDATENSSLESSPVPSLLLPLPPLPFFVIASHKFLFGSDPANAAVDDEDLDDDPDVSSLSLSIPGIFCRIGGPRDFFRSFVRVNAVFKKFIFSSSVIPPPFTRRIRC